MMVLFFFNGVLPSAEAQRPPNKLTMLIEYCCPGASARLTEAPPGE